MKYHFAHLNRIDVSVGQQVSKGQQIGLMGKTGTGSVHLHFEIQKIFRTWTSYTKGLPRDQVLVHYENPYNCDWKSIAPFSHLGWDWLSDIGGGQLHPGIDINSGTGDTDLKTPIKSPVNGKVVYASDDTASGWGKHIFIEEGDNMIVWQPGQDIRFNPDQAKRLYQIIGRREPENNEVIRSRGWELVEGLNTEIENILGNLKGQIAELQGQPPKIVDRPVDNPAQAKEIERLNCLLASKDEDIETFKKERDEALKVQPKTVTYYWESLIINAIKEWWNRRKK